MISGLTYFFSTVKEGMDMICVNYLVLLKEVECSKYKAANNHPHDECIIFFNKWNKCNIINRQSNVKKNWV